MFGIFDSVTNLVTDVVRVAVAPVALVAEVADMIVKPVADVAEDIVKSIKE